MIEILTQESQVPPGSYPPAGLGMDDEDPVKSIANQIAALTPEQARNLTDYILEKLC